jgi:hypothetical protein
VVVGDTVARLGAGSSVAVSPDGSMVAVTWGLGTTVLDTRTHEVIKEIVLPPNGGTGPAGEPLPAAVVWCTGWTPDGGMLLLGVSRGDALASDGGDLVPVDTATWEIRQPSIPTGAAQSIEASPDDRLLAVASAAAEIVLLDAVSLAVVDRVPLADGEFGTDLAFSPDGRLLAAETNRAGSPSSTPSRGSWRPRPCCTTWLWCRRNGFPTAGRLRPPESTAWCRFSMSSAGWCGATR